MTSAVFMLFRAPPGSKKQSGGSAAGKWKLYWNGIQDFILLITPDRKLEEERITQRLEKMVEEHTKALEETHAKLIHQDKMASLEKLSA
jgi:hypothetical protein